MRHVALLIETSGSYGRGLLRGVTKYNREQAQWSTYFQPHGLGAPPPAWLRSWKGDGILARVEAPELAAMLGETGLPVVNLRAAQPGIHFPYVGLDHAAIARLAAEHLLERGLRHFAFCGKPRGVHAGLDERADQFARRIEEAGFLCEQYPHEPAGANGRVNGRPSSDAKHDSKAADTWEQTQDRLAAWIAALPTPVGVMACNDERGLMVLDACRRAGRRVPDEVAVVGVDNDEHLCDLALPPMTSVDVNAEQIGYTAAELLDRLMAGEEAPAGPTILLPRGVVTRRSTDLVATEDAAVNRAVAFIRENAGRGLQVPDVVTHVRMSRASLEPRVKRILGRTIHQEIQRVQLGRVKELLVHSSIPLKRIAMDTGFSCVQYMTRVFHATTGETPARYRTKRQGSPMAEALS